MEIATSLPPDLAALADVSARGAAPPLRAPDAEAAAAPAQTPFALCLALLTGPAPAGEAWPPGGKALPVLPLDPEADHALAGTVTGGLMAVPLAAPGMVAAAPLRALLVPSDASPTGSAPAAAAVSPPWSPTAGAEPLPPSQGSAAQAAVVRGPSPARPDPVAALARGAFETTLLSAAKPDPIGSAPPAAMPAWLEAFAAHDRLAADVAGDARTGPAAAPPAEARPVAVLPDAAAASRATPGAAPSIAPRIELPKNIAALVTAADGVRVASTDWLPPGGGHGSAIGTAAPPPATMPQAPVDTRSPGWQEAFASRVQVVVESQAGEARIKLHPPELGAIDVKVSLVDDKTFVQLTTATAAARDELAHNLPRLRELFTAGGLELGGASVHNGREGQQGGGRGYGAATASTDSTPFAAIPPDAGEASARLSRLAPGRIDIFA